MEPFRRLWLIGLFGLHIALLLLGAFGLRTPNRDVAAVGLVFDVGGKDDRSFNTSAWRGLQRAEWELGIVVQTIEPGDGSDRESALRSLAAGGAEVVIGVGFVFSSDLEKLANEFPKVRFVGIDFSPSGDDAPLPSNLAAIRFREQEGSYLVGVAAGLASKTKTVGFVGGMKIPLIEKFENGFRIGVHKVCPNCNVLVAYAGTEPKAFADPTAGFELAEAQIARGADIVFHAAGKTGDGVFAAVSKHGLRAIGVDSDQFDVAPCCVMTSMVKRIDRVVFQVIADHARGKFTPGLQEFGLQEDGVGYITDSRNQELLPPDLVTIIEQKKNELIERGWEAVSNE